MTIETTDNLPTDGGHKVPLQAALMTCAGYACFNVGDAITKILAHDLSIPSIMLFGALVVLILLVPYNLYRHGMSAFYTEKPGLHFLRALFLMITTVLNIYAFSHIQLATFYTFVFTSPFMVAIMATFFLKEKLDRHKLIGIVIGFLVVIYMLRPGGGLLNSGTLATLGSAAFFSMALIIVRRIGKKDRLSLYVVTLSAMSLVCSVPFVPWHMGSVSLSVASLFLLRGVVSIMGIMLVSAGYHHATSAAAVAPFHYTQIIWGSLLGYFLFADIPSLNVMIGAAILIVTGIYLVRYETARVKRLAA